MEALQTRIRQLEKNNLELSEHNLELSNNNEQLEREKKLNFDSRLKFFERNVEGSHSCRSDIDHSESKENLRKKKKCKRRTKTVFTAGEKISCVVCGQLNR
jgi:hypothetical protein